MFTILTMQIQKHLWPLCAVMGILLTSAFTLTVRAPWDALAIADYLKSIPPIKNKIK
jgi:hypothetical protein